MLALAVVVTFGCDKQIHDAAYQGTQGAIDAVVDRADELPPGTQKKVNAAVEEVTHSAVTGAGKGVKELELEKNLESMLEMVFRETNEGTNELVKTLIEQQGPRLEQTTHRLLVGALRDANAELRTTTQTELPKATRIVISDAVDSFATAMGTEKVSSLRRDLVDTTGAVTYTASSNAVIGLRDELSNPKTVDAISNLTREVVKSATDGAKDSVDKQYLWIVGVALGTLLALCIAALVFYIRKSLLTSRALTVVAQQINKGEHQELKQRIKQKATDRKIEPYLANFLTDRGL